MLQPAGCTAAAWKDAARCQATVHEARRYQDKCGLALLHEVNNVLVACLLADFSVMEFEDLLCAAQTRLPPVRVE